MVQGKSDKVWVSFDFHGVKGLISSGDQKIMSFGMVSEFRTFKFEKYILWLKMLDIIVVFLLLIHADRMCTFHSQQPVITGSEVRIRVADLML